jgi:transposase-like protein
MSATKKLKDSGNIFEVVSTIEATIVGDKDTYSDPIYLQTIESIKNYFKNGSWSRNEKERLIYLYSGRGLKTAEIAERLGMNINTYRSSVSRVSSRLQGILFGDSSAYTSLLEASSEDVAKLKKNVDFLNMSFDILNEFDSDILTKIESFKESSVGSTVTESEYYQAVLFLASFNKKVIEARLNQLNPIALDLVLNELNSSSLTSSMLQYSWLQKEAMKPKKLTETYIEKMNTESGVKKKE